MNIWTAFFLVLSAVVLASPLLSPRSAVHSGPENGGDADAWPEWEDHELKLDLASGRLAEEDFVTMTGRRARPVVGRIERAEGDDGNLSEG